MQNIFLSEHYCNRACYIAKHLFFCVTQRAYGYNFSSVLIVVNTCTSKLLSDPWLDECESYCVLNRHYMFSFFN